MKHSNAELVSSSRIVPPDSMLKFGYSPNGGIEFDSANALLNFSYGGTPKADIGPLGLMVRDGEGVVVGHSAQVSTGGATAEFQVQGTGFSDAAASVIAFSASEQASFFLGRSRGALGTPGTAITSGDALARIGFVGDDGTDIDTYGADLRVISEGTIGSNQIPAKFSFRTANSSGSLVEAFVIDSSQSAILSGTLSVDDTTDSTSTTTGSIHTDGGLGVVKTAFFGSDIRLYDDQNGASPSFSMGTSSSERLLVQVLNGGSNKTIESVKFETQTASGTGNHGEFNFTVDGAERFGIDDVGVNVPNGIAVFDSSVDSAAVANQVGLGAYELSADNRALSISQESTEIVDTDETKFSHRLPVRINGVTRFIMLTDS